MQASRQDGSYPRPQLVRAQWCNLDGEWDFAHDDADVGLSQGWWRSTADEADDPFHLRIAVPIPPEAPASGVGDTGFHPIVWYRRTVAHDDLVDPERPDARSLLHFGAVDRLARVWVDGRLVAEHEGGQTPFSADLTDVLDPDAEEHVVVVRAADDASDVDVPRGKQDWRAEPHGIWYHRTTGIWQTVWAETVPADHLAELAWSSDEGTASLRGEVTLAGRPRRPLWLEVTVRLGAEVLAEQRTAITSATTYLSVALPALRNAQDRGRLQWTPDRPVLLDVEVVLRDRDSDEVVDEVASYTGVRSVSTGAGSFLLNGRPYRLRSVLDQGYRVDTHLASVGTAELRGEVERIREMGFNAVRVHQKAEDPRFLYWADRLGLLVWGETAAAYAFSPRAVTALTTEWLALVRRDRSHPSVVAWVPINESWGVHEIADDPAQQSFARGLAELTRALDPTRPVMSNEGWEHVDSDVFGVHDYDSDPDALRDRYGVPGAAAALRASAMGPAQRRLVIGDGLREGAPLMVTEFGGISLTDDDGAWGYTITRSDTEYAARLRAIFDAVRTAPEVAGFCYTQFMDTGQETNGLLFADGSPKLPLETIREIVTGEKSEAPVPPESAASADVPAPEDDDWHDEADEER